jgi:hypothetical protein
VAPNITFNLNYLVLGTNLDCKAGNFNKLGCTAESLGDIFVCSAQRKVGLTLADSLPASIFGRSVLESKKIYYCSALAHWAQWIGTIRISQAINE